ncbi:hypothetical protein [Nocardioides alcanivorans]|uniref:hypothetical protein n=1 Tax=Nocardioides alcanivorans TaxID=2897352 RepID=UPI001F2A7729|nr:hypothetical protein [Nocardioides alcanivorans]
MSTHDNTPARTRPISWAIPVVGVGCGVAYLVAGIVGDDLGFGIFGLALMLVATGGFLLLRQRSETVQALLDRRDERINHLDLLATTAAGMSVLLTVLVAFVVEIARGEDGAPYYWLGAIGGLVYVVTLIGLRLRK